MDLAPPTTSFLTVGCTRCFNLELHLHWGKVCAYYLLSAHSCSFSLFVCVFFCYVTSDYQSFFIFLKIWISNSSTDSNINQICRHNQHHSVEKPIPCLINWKVKCQKQDICNQFQFVNWITSSIQLNDNIQQINTPLRLFLEVSELSWMLSLDKYWSFRRWIVERGGGGKWKCGAGVMSTT